MRRPARDRSTSGATFLGPAAILSSHLDHFVEQPVTEAVAFLALAGIGSIRTVEPGSPAAGFVPGRATIVHDARARVLSISIEGGAASRREALPAPYAAEMAALIESVDALEVSIEADRANLLTLKDVDAAFERAKDQPWPDQASG